MERFAKILQTDIDANLAWLSQGIDPTLTLVVYTRKQELCQETASDSGVSISEKTMVTTGTKNAVATGRMVVAWRKWMCTIALNRSWNAWKSHWTQALQEKREIQKLAGMPFNGMVNSSLEAEMGDNMITALDNLENAAVQKNGNVERLVIANKALTDSLVDRDAECDRLLTIINALSTGRGTAAAAATVSHHGNPMGTAVAMGTKLGPGIAVQRAIVRARGIRIPSMQNEVIFKVDVCGTSPGRQKMREATVDGALQRENK